MRVLGAGLPRAATTTQMIALETLGFGHCYHMRDLLGDMEGQLPLWEAVMEGKPDWEAIVGKSQSTADWPASRFYKELLETYPDAKVMLNVRGAESWAKSMRETVWAVYFGESILRHLCAVREQVDPLWRRYIDVLTWFTWSPENGALAPAQETFTEEGLMAAMERWNQRVKQDVPADQLIVWEPAEGWEPLCEFLKVPVPQGPVPRTNDTSAFKDGIIGGAISQVNAWWDARDRPQEGLHGGASSS